MAVDLDCARHGAQAVHAEIHAHAHTAAALGAGAGSILMSTGALTARSPPRREIARKSTAARHQERVVLCEANVVIVSAGLICVDCHRQCQRGIVP